MKHIKDSLRIWFIIHFIVDYIIALPLLIAPRYTLALFGWDAIDPIGARIIAAALFAIGGISLIYRNAEKKVLDAFLTLKLIFAGTAILGILITIIEGLRFASLWIILGVFTLFLFVWLYYKVLLR